MSVSCKARLYPGEGKASLFLPATIAPELGVLGATTGLFLRILG